jgi:hypothetical protein
MPLPLGQAVSLRLSSEAFDPYLIVRSPGGQQWDNDDAEPGNMAAGLELWPTENGAYELVATSYQAGETGPYTLVVRSGASQGAVPPATGPSTPPGTAVPPSASPGGGVVPPPQPPAVTPPTASGVRSQPGGGQVYGLYVGITNYPNNALPLCAEDAVKLAEDMRRAGLQTPAEQIVLTDQQATPAGLRQAFTRLHQQVGPNDLFIFFYSGHGGQSEEQPTSSELDRREESINLINGDVSDDELAQLLEGIRARVVLVALDSCFSGGFARDLVCRPGRMGVFSSDEDLTSNVAARFQAGGYLSHFLRLGLRGEADRSPRDGLLTAGELAHYLYTMFGSHLQDVPAVTTDHVQSHQHLVIDRGSVRVSTPLVSYR